MLDNAKYMLSLLSGNNLTEEVLASEPKPRVRKKSIKPSKMLLNSIKNFGKLPVDPLTADQSIDIILKNMELYRSSLALQRVSLHALSNISMDTRLANIIVQKKIGHKVVIRALKKYSKDWKLSWFGCSCLWNMTRPEDNRAHFDQDIIRLILSILQKHITKRQIVNTVLGTLSNLSLEQKFKTYVQHEKFIRKIMAVIGMKLADNIIAPTSAGLLANLAINEPVCDLLVQHHAIRMISVMLKQINTHDQDYSEYITLHRNCVSALNNFISSDKYLYYGLISQLLEQLLPLVHKTNEPTTLGLTMTCIDAFGLRAPEMVFTTSYHVAAYYGYTKILKTIMNDDTNLEIQDTEQATPLDKALQHGNINNIQYLIKCGASTDHIRLDNFKEETQVAIAQAIHTKSTCLEIFEGSLTSIINQNPRTNQLYFPPDLSFIVISFLPVYSISKIFLDEPST